MTKTPAISPLGYALIGLLNAKPSTGYALRKVFETTPLASYSSSPGSIYPALQKLENLGMISPTKAGDRTLMLTPRGKQALDDWLQRPVTSEEVSNDLGSALLRFAFLQDHPDPKLTRTFLDSFEEAARARAAELKAFLKSDAAAALPPHSRLAVEHGLRSIKSSADWAADARKQFKAAKKEKGK